MCQPKYWNNFHTKEVESHLDRNEISLHIIGERSDFEIFDIEIIISKTDNHLNIANKFKKALDAIESFRDCDCSIKAGQCVKHFSTIQLSKFGIGVEQGRVQIVGG